MHLKLLKEGISMRMCVLSKNPFFTNVEPRFKTFKEKIQKMATKNKIVFNEDVFMDTLIKCMNTFINENPKDSDIDKYFWVAYRQNIINTISRDKFKNTTEVSALGDMLDDDNYNEEIDILAEMTEKAIEERFGHRILQAWKLHVCEDLTYKEIAKLGYDDINLHNEFREIKRYMTGKYLKTNSTYAKLAKENNLF